MEASLEWREWFAISVSARMKPGWDSGSNGGIGPSDHSVVRQMVGMLEA